MSKYFGSIELNTIDYENSFTSVFNRVWQNDSWWYQEYKVHPIWNIHCSYFSNLFFLKNWQYYKIEWFWKIWVYSFQKAQIQLLPKIFITLLLFLTAEHFLHRKFHFKIQIFIERELLWLNLGVCSEFLFTLLSPHPSQP